VTSAHYETAKCAVVIYRGYLDEGSHSLQMSICLAVAPSRLLCSAWHFQCPHFTILKHLATKSHSYWALVQLDISYTTVVCWVLLG